MIIPTIPYTPPNDEEFKPRKPKFKNKKEEDGNNNIHTESTGQGLPLAETGIQGQAEDPPMHQPCVALLRQTKGVE
jgi:hypothetical protein